MLKTIEDLLEYAAGLHKESQGISLEKSDMTIMNSIARQVFKGTPLTDRQYALMQEKLYYYKDSFDCEFDVAVDTLRMPLRQIDRTKYIKIVDFEECVKQDEVYESYKSEYKWIKIRFPFSKKLISLIQELPANVKQYFHSKGSHEHCYMLTEQNILLIYEKFQDRGFDIDEKLKEYYSAVKVIKSAPEHTVSGFFDGQLLNLHPKAKELAHKEIGPLGKDNITHYVDRRRRYGIDIIPDNITSTVDKKYITNRDDVTVLAKPSEIKLETLLEDLHFLDRFPMLVVLNNSENELDMCFQFFRDLIPSEEQSVLFREDGEAEFNNLVKQYKLNNWVDKNTKIVYINKNKLPKVLFSSEFKPITALCFDSMMNRNVDSYMRNFCDLIIFREETVSSFRRYSRYHGRL